MAHDPTIVDSVRVGRILRELRRRRAWTQAELGQRVPLSQQAISLIERGHGFQLSIETLTRVFAAVDARLEPVVSWRGGDLDRLLDSAHATVVSETIRRLRREGWEVAVEVTYSEFGERGSIDILGARRDLEAAVVVEVKSELTVVEATARKLDEKARLVRQVIGQARFGFTPRRIGRLLVLPSTTAARRRVDQAGPALEAALPSRGSVVRRWLRHPVGDVVGILFVPITNPSSGTRSHGGSKRIRRARSAIPQHRGTPCERLITGSRSDTTPNTTPVGKRGKA